MTEDAILSILNQFPNFIGFVLLGLFLYRALMASIANNREIVRQLMDCYNQSISKD